MCRSFRFGPLDTFLFRLLKPFLVAFFQSSVRSENLTLELLASSTLLKEGVEGMPKRVAVGETYRPAVVRLRCDVVLKPLFSEGHCLHTQSPSPLA